MTRPHPHGGQPVSIFGTPLREARLAAILVHGRTQTPADMDELIVRRLQLPGVAYLAPAAEGSSWYPARFMAPAEENEPRLGSALACLEALSSDLAAQGFGPGRQVLIGFSQGACLVCTFAWQQRQRLAGLLAFTGGLIGEHLPEVRTGAQPLDGMPVLLAGCEQDGWVPAHRVRASANLFRQAGCEVTEWLDPGSEHTVRDHEILLARGLLQRLLDTLP